MLVLHRRVAAEVNCRIWFSERDDHADGIIGADSIASADETWLNQEHGREVVHVNKPGDRCGEPADAAWTTELGAALLICTADCVPISIYGAGPNTTAVAAIHAGWKGLLAGVVQATAAALEQAGVNGLRAVVGPYIHAGRYEFGRSDLDNLVQRYGSHIAASTASGAPALDLGAATLVALSESGVRLDYDLRSCTAANADRYFSHRARGETERMTMGVELVAGVPA